MIFALIAREGHPSVASAIVGVVLATLFTCAHTALYFYHKTWFLYLLVVSTIFQTIGFTTRLAWIAVEGHDGPLYASYLIMMVTPSLTLAACHMTFGRILAHKGSLQQQRTQSFLPSVRHITPVFVSFDVVALCVQLVGGSLTCAAYITSSDAATPNMGLLDVGLQINKWTSVAQIIYLGLFALLTIRFLWLSTPWQHSSTHSDFLAGALTWVTSISSTLIMLQEINSVVELDSAIRSLETYSAKHEWVFWIVDALPIFLVFLAFAIVHPGRCLPANLTRFHLKEYASLGDSPGQSTVKHQPYVEPSIDDVYDKPLPPPPPPAETHSEYSDRSQDFQSLGQPGTHRLVPDRWISTSGKTRWYHEISPYESEKSYRAYMHGAL